MKGIKLCTFYPCGKETFSSGIENHYLAVFCPVKVVMVFEHFQSFIHCAGLQDRQANNFTVTLYDTVFCCLHVIAEWRGPCTYDLMTRYWPTPQAMKHDPVVADG
jgi:hypothetical protein